MALGGWVLCCHLWQLHITYTSVLAPHISFALLLLLLLLLPL
jgi:hypothetical protein